METKEIDSGTDEKKAPLRGGRPGHLNRSYETMEPMTA